MLDSMDYAAIERAWEQQWAREWEALNEDNEQAGAA
jgi:hypothetical protein